VVGVASVVVALSLGAYACGGSGKSSQTGAAMSGEVAGVAADDRSRCDFKGRSDREVVESLGPGAKRANIRRVYGVVGEGEERHRVLMCREVDTNLDGVKDVVRTYTDKGEALNEVADTNFDGKMDTWITFAKGRVAKLREDHNGDGQDDENHGRDVRRVEHAPHHLELVARGLEHRERPALGQHGQIITPPTLPLGANALGLREAH
jgi:hypothetical protein